MMLRGRAGDDCASDVALSHDDCFAHPRPPACQYHQNLEEIILRNYDNALKDVGRPTLNSFCQPEMTDLWEIHVLMSMDLSLSIKTSGLIST